MGYKIVTTTLIIGCGYLGHHVAQRLHRQAGHAVFASTRRPERAAALSALGIPSTSIDLDDVSPPAIPLPNTPYRLLYLVAPPPNGEFDTRLSRVLSLLAKKPPAHIVYVGTSGVYGDCGGRWVDETAIPQPNNARARRRLHAEQQLRQWCMRHHCSRTLLRVSGIYGPDRLPIERIRQARPVVAPLEAPWSNRIHIEDLSTICIASLNRIGHDELFNVSDGNPSSSSEFILAVADAQGLPRPPTTTLSAALSIASPAERVYLSESRRLDNRLLIEKLGIELRYPTFSSTNTR